MYEDVMTLCKQDEGICTAAAAAAGADRPGREQGEVIQVRQGMHQDCHICDQLHCSGQAVAAWGWSSFNHSLNGLNHYLQHPVYLYHMLQHHHSTLLTLGQELRQETCRGNGGRGRMGRRK